MSGLQGGLTQNCREVDFTTKSAPVIVTLAVVADHRFPLIFDAQSAHMGRFSDVTASQDPGQAERPHRDCRLATSTEA